MVENGEQTRLLESPERIPYLLFRAQECVYGVHARLVHEIVLLPQLKSIAEQTRQFIGVLNLRGVVVPVMDLELRFGRKRGSYSLSDYLLVLESGDQLLALVVNDVIGVQRVDPEQLEKTARRATHTGATCIEKIASFDDHIVMLLNVACLFSSPGPPPAQDTDASAEPESPAETAVPLADQAVFRRRADRLRQSGVGSETEELTPLAVAEIGGEFYAFELEFVREFFEVQQVTPVPCCPPRIMGNVNLRGDVLTVIDVRGHLNLPIGDRVAKCKAIVARTDALTAGVVVDQLHGVLYLPVAELTSVAGGAYVPGETAVKGTAPFRDTMMSILDVPRLLALESWVVDESIG